MKRLLLLTSAVTCLTVLYAQEKKITAYAITGIQKGSSAWTEVRLVDITTGEEVQSVYKSAQEVKVLNARTKKPVIRENASITAAAPAPRPTQVEIIRKDINGNTVTIHRRMMTNAAALPTDKPFATNSAALAFDKKHNRLYYTPMGINQLRYIDLKTGNIFYFEEPFGALQGRHDIPNQITRMVIASDGNGYALTNDAKHLIQFTTGKKPKITDLGAITDDAGNAAFSIHNRDGYGGDIIADAQKNIYLVTASRNVFKISLETKVATYLGGIRGLPRGFTTNGAAVEEDSKVIVTSSTQTGGYYRFDLNTLQAEKLSAGAQVFNASDLANGNLAFAKKKKDRQPKDTRDVVINETPFNQQSVPATASRNKETVRGEIAGASIVAYPNPVSNGGVVKLSFNEQPQGRYAIQFMDAAGRIVSQQQVNIQSKTQVVDLRLPSLITAGNYLIKILNDANEVASVNKLVVQ